jgi:hypothetical protein
LITILACPRVAIIVGHLTVLVAEPAIDLDGELFPNG